MTAIEIPGRICYTDEKPCRRGEAKMAKLYTREEARRRRMKFQIFAGLFDFLAVVVGVIVIIACVILLSSLIRWIIGDVPVTFKSLWDMLMRALVLPE